MSDFKCEVVRVGKVSKHPNADRLQVAKAWDYDCVIGLDSIKEGELAVYIPEGALVPPDVLELLGNPKLSGSRYNRVKAINIRGVLSQGLLLKLDGLEEGQDLTQGLGITKWDPATEALGRMTTAHTRYCPDKVFGFDVENIKRNKAFFTQGERVVVTEKIHGTFCYIGVFADGDIVISSKGLAGRGEAFHVTEEEEVSNLYLRIGLPLARKFLHDHLPFLKEHGNVAFLGEIYGKGIQDMSYDTEPTFACFDVVVDGKFRDPDGAWTFCNTAGVPFVPILGTPQFDMVTITGMAAENSALGKKGLREGVVIRALHDAKRRSKFINPAYLVRKNGTEFN